MIACAITTNFELKALHQRRLQAEQIRQAMLLDKSYQDRMIAILDAQKIRYSKDGFYMTWNSLKDMPVKDKVVLSSIAACESGFYVNAYNPKNKNGSTDGGLWQINSVHKLVNRNDPIQNKKKAVELYKDGYGLSNWKPSKHCWNPMIAKFDLKNILAYNENATD